MHAWKDDIKFNYIVAKQILTSIFNKIKEEEEEVYIRINYMYFEHILI